jgi:hypothetical protein
MADLIMKLLSARARGEDNSLAISGSVNVMRIIRHSTAAK